MSEMQQENAPAEADVCHLPWPRRPAGFKPLLSRLGTAFKMSEAQLEALKSLYVDAKPVPVQPGQHLTQASQSLRQFQFCELTWRTSEVALAFWGFVENRQVRNELLSVLCDTLKPRVACAADTRKSGFECFMVIDNTGAAALATGLQLEVWLEAFLETLNISGGVCRFTSFMDSSMVACIDRIEQHSKDGCFGNLLNPHNRDFYRLYVLKRSVLHGHADARMHTGMDLTVANMAQLYIHQSEMASALRRQNEQERLQNQRRRATEAAELRRQQEQQAARRGALEAARVILELHRNNSISEDMRDHILGLLGLRATNITTATRHVDMLGSAAIIPFGGTVMLLRAVNPVLPLSPRSIDASVRNGVDTIYTPRAYTEESGASGASEEPLPVSAREAFFARMAESDAANSALRRDGVDVITQPAQPQPAQPERWPGREPYGV